jgi:3-hydroxyisobutyrate dehydrogenase
MKIGFIGLGNMGAPMVANIVKAGHQVTGFDLTDAGRAAGAAAGASIAASEAACVTGAEVLVTMLPNSEIAKTVWRSVIDYCEKGLLAIDCSTIDVASAQELHQMAKRTGLRSVDAPVSGGVGGAVAGSLTFMCGGEADAIAAAMPILESMGKKIVACGAGGAGQAAKICNNMILGISMIAVCEAFALADRVGLDRQAMFDVVSSSSGSCWSINTYCPVPGVGPKSPADNGYAPGFAANLMLKDLNLAMMAAETAGAQTPLGRHAASMYDRFVAEGGGSRDFSAIIESLSAGRDLS